MRGGVEKIKMSRTRKKGQPETNWTIFAAGNIRHF